MQATSADPSAALTEESHALVELNLAIAEWEQRRDAAAKEKLNDCLSPDLIFRRADRAVVDKETFMKGLEGDSPFTNRESRNPSVKISGERAVVILTVVGTRRDGSRGYYRNIRLFVRTDHKWQMEFWFNDDLTSLAEP